VPFLHSRKLVWLEEYLFQNGWFLAFGEEERLVDGVCRVLTIMDDTQDSVVVDEEIENEILKGFERGD